MTGFRRFLVWSVAATLGAYLLISAVNTHQDKRAERAKAEATELKGRVDALQEQARQHATAANQHRQENEAWGKEVAALKAKLARVKSQSSNPELAVVQVQPVDAPVDTAADQLKDEIIAALDNENTSLKAEVGELRQTIEIKDRVIAVDERRIRGLEIALDAQKHAVTSGKWLGRLQGFAIGVGIGFVGGKL